MISRQLMTFALTSFVAAVFCMPPTDGGASPDPTSTRPSARKPVPAAVTPGTRTGNRRFHAAGHVQKHSSGLIKG